MAVYRSNYLKKIAIVPKNLYRDANKPYSKSSIEWLEFIAAQKHLTIAHACNGGEQAIFDMQLGETYYVDGFCEETKTVFEFYGCLYHACPMCFDSRSDHPFYNERKMYDVYQETIKRGERLQELRWQLKTIWEHDFRRLKETDEMNNFFLDTCDIVTDLEPRDAFFGGRVNGFKLFRDAKEDETINFYDFTSLYPAVQKFKKFGLRHPVIIRENFQDISNYMVL